MKPAPTPEPLPLVLEDTPKGPDWKPSRLNSQNLRPIETQLVKIAAVCGWIYGGGLPHARGFQLLFWRGDVGAISEIRIARLSLARWTARQVRKLR
jgi:hypothetical protein